MGAVVLSRNDPSNNIHLQLKTVRHFDRSFARDRRPSSRLEQALRSGEIFIRKVSGSWAKEDFSATLGFLYPAEAGRKPLSGRNDSLGGNGWAFPRNGGRGAIAFPRNDSLGGNGWVFSRKGDVGGNGWAFPRNGLSVAGIVSVFLFLLCTASASAQAVPQIRRICVSSFSQAITISWNPYTDTCLGTNRVRFFGYLATTGKLKEIDSIPYSGAPAYEHTLRKAMFSDYRDSFYIEYSVSCGPGSLPRRSKAVREDITPPKAINFDSVSVDRSNNILLGWTPEGSKDIKGYIIYRSTGVVNSPVDTVFGSGSNSYIDLNPSPSPMGGSVAYRIAAVDSCDNVADLGRIDSSMHLSTAVDPCRNAIRLSWSAYIGWPVASYELMLSSDQGLSYQRIYSGLARTFDFLTGVKGQRYYFFVRAHKAGSATISASSNTLFQDANFVDRAGGVHIQAVDVSFDGKSQRIYYRYPSATGISQLILLRGRDSMHLSAVDTQSIAQSQSMADPFFSDHVQLPALSAAPASYPLYYAIQPVSSCGLGSAHSPLAQPLSLSVPKYDPVSGVRSFRFNHPQQYSGYPHLYQIYRFLSNAGRISSLSAGTLLATLDSSKSDYTDAEELDSIPNDGYCYAVSVLAEDSFFTAGHPALITDSLPHSAIVCSQGALRVYFPTAFRVSTDALTPVFRPVIQYADLQASQLSIYSRWGERVYRTNDISLGWTGHFNNDPATDVLPEGVYLYQAIITDKLGNVSQYSGTVVLVR